MSTARRSVVWSTPPLCSPISRGRASTRRPTASRCTTNLSRSSAAPHSTRAASTRLSTPSACRRSPRCRPSSPSRSSSRSPSPSCAPPAPRAPTGATTTSSAGWCLSRCCRRPPSTPRSATRCSARWRTPRRPRGRWRRRRWRGWTCLTLCRSAWRTSGCPSLSSIRLRKCSARAARSSSWTACEASRNARKTCRPCACRSTCCSRWTRGPTCSCSRRMARAGAAFVPLSSQRTRRKSWPSCAHSCKRRVRRTARWRRRTTAAARCSSR
mmetsp:Transcript_27801/g.63800  ORF Transcript_27801/g.63800 Transcript_27801/m.63800 type:complete len:269 (+) Transcript_27801:818-1624(+)